MRNFYLTKKGLERIKKEYEDLRRLKFLKFKKKSSGFLLPGDLNPGYLSSQENPNFLETRIIELENVLKNIELIKTPHKKKQNIITLGATVALEDKDGQINEFMIVGALEADPDEGKISFESPVGKTLLGHKIGDEIMITSPVKVVYRIKKIRYCSCG